MQLVSNSTGAIADTLVMANLGYMQFRATPGVYSLEIREGKGREIYEIESVGNEGWKSPSVAEGGDMVTITSLDGLALYPRLMRKPGMERADVLAEDEEPEEESENLVDSIVSGYVHFTMSSAGVGLLCSECFLSSARTKTSRMSTQLQSHATPISTSSPWHLACSTRYAHSLFFASIC